VEYDDKREMVTYGTFGMCLFNSGAHFADTFCNDTGLSKPKQICIDIHNTNESSSQRMQTDSMRQTTRNVPRIHQSLNNLMDVNDRNHSDQLYHINEEYTFVHQPIISA
jgi:hypothetical protein